jgi:hypothetical protein
MALCDDCKLLAIIIRAMGIIKLHVGGFLINMDFMMSLCGIIVTVEQYGFGLMIEGFRYVYHCQLTRFLSVVVVTLTQSQRNCQQSLCYFLQTPSGG